MSLKYRLILLTVAVFAAAFGAAALLGLHGARRLAERQLAGRLRRSAEALAASGAPLNDEALARIGPLLNAHVMVMPWDGGDRGRVRARSGGDVPWDALAEAFTPMTVRPAPGPVRTPDGRRYYVARATRTGPAGARRAEVLLFVEADAVREPAQALLRAYLLVVGPSALLLACGTYVVGWTVVRRVNRLARRIDETLSEDAVTGDRRGDELRRLSAAFRDLRVRLDRSRRRLARQQRLATTGKLASSVAHEVRNPLQAVRLTVQMLRERCGPEGREGCDLVLAEIDRLSLLTDELLVLAGKDTSRAEAVDVARQVRETVRLLQHQLRQRGIRAEVDLPDLPAVRVDPNRCRQLLLNLLLNAVEASPSGGRVGVTGRAAGGEVTVAVSDEGGGFPACVLGDRAEEFFSTKSSGAGLGLSICRRIVSEAAGRLKLYNTDSGAVAEVTLPADREGART